MAKGPFAVFRKHQKVLLAVFGVALMIAFVVGPPLVDFLSTQQGGGGGENLVVVSWTGGQIRETQLRAMRNTRILLLQFFEEVVRTAGERNNQFSPQGLGVPNTDAERSLIQTMVLAEKAKQLGLVINDEAVISHLIRFTDETLQKGDFREVMVRSVGRRQMTDEQLFDALRREIAAQTMGVIARSGISAGQFRPITTPHAAWQYHNQLRRRVKAELMPIDVNGYLKGIDDPSIPQLQEFFKQYQGEFSLPDQSKPGFKRRRRIAFDYVKFDFNAFFDDELTKVTDEQVQQEYEQTKDDRFRVTKLPSDDETGAAEEPAETTDEQSKDGPTTGDSDDLDATDSDVNNSSEPEEGQQNDGAETNKADTKEADDKQPNDAPPENGETGESGSSGGSPGPDTATPDDQSSDTQNNQAVTDPVPSETAVDETNADEQSDGDSPLEDQTSDDSDRAAEESTDVVPTEPDTAGDDGSDKSAGETVDDEQEPQYQPLEDVAGEVRETIARRQAQLRLNEAMGNVEQAVKAYYQSVLFDERDSTGGRRQAPPSRPDVAALAEGVGVTGGTTPLVDAVQISRDFELGQSSQKPSEASMMAGRFNSIPFVEIAFRDAARPYQTRRLLGADPDTHFVYWALAEDQAYEPDLDDASLAVSNRAEPEPNFKTLNRDAPNEIGTDSTCAIRLSDPLCEGVHAEVVWKKYGWWLSNRAADAETTSLNGRTVQEARLSEGSWIHIGSTRLAFRPAVREEVVRAWKLPRAADEADKEAERMAEQARATGRSLAESFPTEDVIQTDEFSWMSGGNLPPQFGLSQPSLSTVQSVDGEAQDVGSRFMRTVAALEQGQIGVTSDDARSVVYLVRITNVSPTEDLRRDEFLKLGGDILSRMSMFQVAAMDRVNLERTWYEELESEMQLKWEREPLPASRR